MSLTMSTTKKRGSLIGFATRYIYSVVDSEKPGSEHLLKDFFGFSTQL